MKKLLIAIVAIVSLVSSHKTLAQSSGTAGFQTLSSGETAFGGYGAGSLRMSSIDGQFAAFAGGYGGMFINKSIMIGGGGYALASDVNIKQSVIDQARLLNPVTSGILSFGYGGPMIEVIFLNNDAIHFGAGALLGFGSASAVESSGRSFANGRVILLEPSLFLEFNVSPWFRVAAGGSYRAVMQSRLSEYGPSTLSGPSADVTLKFGKFW